MPCGCRRRSPDASSTSRDLAAQDRDREHALGVGGRGEQAEEAALADRPSPSASKLLDADVVEVGRPVDRRARVGLGEDEQLRLAGLAPVPPAAAAERRDSVLVGAQDAEPGAGHARRSDVLAVDLAHEVVLAVAEEREVVVGEPAQQLPASATSSSGSGGGSGGELVGRCAGRASRIFGPVLDGLAHVAEHPPQARCELVEARPASVSRSISMCIQDSTSGVGRAARRRLPRRRTSTSAPVTSGARPAAGG